MGRGEAAGEGGKAGRACCGPCPRGATPAGRGRSWRSGCGSALGSSWHRFHSSTSKSVWNEASLSGRTQTASSRARLRFKSGGGHPWDPDAQKLCLLLVPEDHF